MAQTIYIAGDHAAFALKQKIIAALTERGFKLEDLGTDSEESVDYPDFAHRLAKKVQQDDHALGILMCGTGIGASITANRHAGIRAALVTNAVMAQMAKKHNNANVLVLGGRLLSADEALPLIDIWMQETYEGGRHERRLKKIELQD